MTSPAPYTSNYHDLSTDQGFQFEFLCERCGTGYTSTFKTSKVDAMGSKAAHGLGGMFGGKLSKVADKSNALLHDVAGAKEKEKALSTAADEVRASFNQCNNCGKWVCVGNCWNADMAYCADCAAAEEPLQCPSCGAQSTKAAKFCPECGKAMPVDIQCSGCGGVVAAGTKFCPSCGMATATT